MQLKLEKGGATIMLADDPFAHGGEANLYTVPGVENLIAKVYHRPTQDRTDKLRVMIANPPSDPMSGTGTPSIAWPIDRLVDLDNPTQCLGYVMPRAVNPRTVFEFYNPRTRRQQCPLFHYRYLVRTARNLASAFRALHERGYVVGDVNESNILVSDTALVTLVDTDSFQVSDGQHIYRCPVGKQEFTPPELQGVHFRETDRSPVHDLFGLAVLIFLLLMEGTHPFAGRLSGDGEPDAMADRILKGYYVYSVMHRGPYKPMPVAPPIGLLHPEVRNLMRQCFEVGHFKPAQRPTAAQWQQALDIAERNQVTCHVNHQHFYRVGFGACPWCQRAELLGGWDPFPSREAVSRGEHLKTISAVRLATPMPTDLNVKLPDSTPEPPVG